MIKDTGRVDDLPLGVFVLAVANEQILRGECIRLHIDVCFGHVVDETRFTNVREASNDKGSCVRVDLGQSG